MRKEAGLARRSLVAQAGFTLIELLIVIIIILILMTSVIALFNEMYRGEGVRQGARVVWSAVSNAREAAASERVTMFVKFYNGTDGAVVEVWRDKNGNRMLDTGDELIGTKMDLPKYCFFKTPGIGDTSAASAHWLRIEPTGYIVFNAFTGVQQSAYDANWNGAAPGLMGDVCLQMKDRPYEMGIDIDTVVGKVRRMDFRYTGN